MGNKSSRSRGHDERQSAADGRKRSLFSAKTPSDAPLAQGKEASPQCGAHGHTASEPWLIAHERLPSDGRIGTSAAPESTHVGSAVEQAESVAGTLHEDLLATQWPPHSPPAAGAAHLAAWPARLPHCSVRLFRDHAAAEEAHNAAPRWHLRGDIKCSSDTDVSVEVRESGLQVLRSIAQIQKGLMSRAAEAKGKLGSGAGGAQAQFLSGHRPLFSYKRYADQEPLEMSLAETAAVVALVLGPEAVEGLLGAEYAPLLSADSFAADTNIPSGGMGGQGDKMASILIKLLLDMWLAGNVHDTFALVLGMLQAALRQPDTTFRVRVYDLVYNLALHAHMIESDAAEGGAPEGCDSARPSRAGAEALAAMGADEAAAQGSPLCIPRGVRARMRDRTDLFLCWLRSMLFALMLTSARGGEKVEDVWRAAAGALVHLLAEHGALRAAGLQGLSNEALAALVDTARQHSWSLELQSALLCATCHICYLPATEDGGDRRRQFSREALEAFGGPQAMLTCLCNAPTELSRRCMVAVLLSFAEDEAARGDEGFAAYRPSLGMARVRGMLCSPDAADAMALAMVSAQSAPLAMLPQAFARQLASGGDARGEPRAQAVADAVAAQRALTRALPSACGSGGTKWHDEQQRMLQGFLLTDREDGGRSHATLAAMLAGTDANTAARAAQLLAAVFWHSRAAEARDAAAEGLALKRAPDATAVAAAALLPPPPPAGASAGVGAADALVRALRAPATARGAARVLVDTVAQLVATALACKQDLGPQGSARSTGQHLLVVVATLAAAVQWLRVLQHSAQRGPVLCLVRLLLETLTVPRPSADNDSARHHSGRATTSEATQPPAPYLSPISQFLQGEVVMPSFVAAMLPTTLLLLMRDRLATPAPPPRSRSAVPALGPEALPLASAGFAGWLSIDGAGRAASGAKAAASRDTHSHADANVDAGLRCGSCSVEDACLAIQLVLVAKFQMDDAALEAAGGCVALKAALQDSDTRVRFVAAEFMLSRAKSHKPEEVRGALQALLRMAQSSKDGALVENPYVQLQAYLANGLLTIDDL